MTISDGITVLGIVVTVVATLITIWQAASARDSSRKARTAMDQVRLAAIADRLRSAQEHIRALPTAASSVRGAKTPPGVARIRQEFDNTLGALATTGPGSRARKLVVDAQNSLNQYALALPTVDQAAWQSLQSAVQDAISELTTAVSRLETPHDRQ